jgi:arylsulfatase A-like enzyme
MIGGMRPSGPSDAVSETANGRSDRPDVVVVMTDQQRFDQIGYASAGHFETPNLDALAARGVIFERAYSASTVCSRRARRC